MKLGLSPDTAAGREALRVAIPFFVVSAVYIVASTLLVGGRSGTVEEMMRWELGKGLVFVALTSALIFGLVRWRFMVVDRRSDALMRDRDAEAARQGEALLKTAAASIAHDSNNMVASILLGVDLMRTDPALPGSLRQSTEKLLEAARQLSQLNNRLMAAAELSDELRPEILSTGNIVAKLMALKSQHADFQSKRFTVEEAKGKHCVNADPSLLVQALFNLLLNAAQHTGPSGQIRLETKPDGDWFEFAVHDDGPGIPSADRRKVFHAYYSTRQGGKGMGLLSVKACENAGSIVFVEDSPLGGALFRLRLPLAKA